MEDQEVEQYEEISTSDCEREDNIKLWRSVEKTPTSQVKGAKMDGRSVKSVKAHYQRMRATEIFGPFGKGWGIVPESVSFTEKEIGGTHLIKYTATMFYIQDSERSEFPICATVKEAYVTNKGQGYLKIDDEADKKAATNALTKGLSFLGFSADVFHGLYDDSKYVNQLYAEEGITQEVEGKQENLDYMKWRQTIVADVMLCKSIDELEKVYFQALRDRRPDDTSLVLKLDETKTKRFEELSNKENKNG